MICNFCKEKEASVSIEQIFDGTSKNIYLCKDCARKFGLGSFSDNIDISITTLFKQQEQLSQKQIKESPECPECGRKLSDIRLQRKIGCTNCFLFFKKEILEILQEKKKNLIYTGQIQTEPIKEFSHKISEIELKNKLKIAIEDEEYELAAKLRDELKSMENDDAKNSR